MIRRIDSGDFSDITDTISEKNRLLARLDSMFNMHVEGVKLHSYSAKNTDLFVSLLLETKDLIAITARFMKFYHRNVGSPTLIEV